MIRRPFTTLLACVALAGCALAPARLPAPPAVADNANLNAVAWTQTAVEHDLIHVQTWRTAQALLLDTLHDPQWDALAGADRVAPLAQLPPAVIVDVDETVLDNSPYQARVLRNGGEYNADDWAAWCREERARALPGALAFAQFAASHGITVIYISNRVTALDTVTVANLRRVGFPVDTAQAFMGLGTVVAGCTQVDSAKGCRRQAVSRHYRVLMQFGDQLGDFVDAPAQTIASREETADRYLAWIGTRWFVLPNPTYGSWESALLHNDGKAPRAQRRQIKLDGLRYD